MCDESCLVNLSRFFRTERNMMNVESRIYNSALSGSGWAAETRLTRTSNDTGRRDIKRDAAHTLRCVVGAHGSSSALPGHLHSGQNSLSLLQVCPRTNAASAQTLVRSGRCFGGSRDFASLRLNTSSMSSSCVCDTHNRSLR